MQLRNIYLINKYEPPVPVTVKRVIGFLYKSASNFPVIIITHHLYTTPSKQWTSQVEIGKCL